MTKQEFIEFVQAYKPTRFEVETDKSLYYPGSHFLQTQAHRFYRILSFLREHNGFRKYLDLGCYPGTTLNVARSFFPQAVIYGAGLGMSKEFRKEFRKFKLFEVNLDPDVYFEGYGKVPLKVGIADNSMEVITATEIFEHLYNPLHMIKEVHRLLARGGYCYLTTNNISYLPGIPRILKGETNLERELKYSTIGEGKTNWRGHVRFYCKRELEEVFALTGFREFQVKYVTFQSWFKNKRTRWTKDVVRGILGSLNTRYGSHLECVARK